MDPKQLRGAVAISSGGSIGVISGSTEREGKIVYYGFSFSGKQWASRQPRILAFSMQEYIANKVEDSITNERKSYLDALRRIKRSNSDTEDKAIVGSVVAAINQRASERREQRAMAPTTPVAESPAIPVEQVITDNQGQTAEKDLVLRLWQDPSVNTQLEIATA